MKEFKELKWSLTRRDFLNKTGAWAGAGLLLPVLPLIGEGKSIAAAYPEEVLSIEKYTKGRVKPGMIISKDNVELVKDLCTEGLYIELGRGGQIKIAQTTTRAEALLPRYWLEATLRNKGQAMLDKKGQIWTRDGKPWIGGFPFPEPNSALEAVWNHCFNNRLYDDLMTLVQEVDIDSDGTVVREGLGGLVRIQTVGRLAVEPKPILPAYKTELFRSVVFILAPFDSYGLAVLSTISYDATTLPDTDLYIPTLRRTRRVPSTQRFEPTAPYATWFASDFELHNDPVLTWSWKLVGRKPMLMLSPANLGAFAKGASKDDYIYAPSKVKFPRSTWELRPEVIIVDGEPTSFPESPYSRKRLYIDAISNRAYLGDMWDKAGKIWRSMIFAAADTGVPYVGGTIIDWTGSTFIDLQKDYRSHAFFVPKHPGGWELKVNTSLKIDDWATPTAMLRNARR